MRREHFQIYTAIVDDAIGHTFNAANTLGERGSRDIRAVRTADRRANALNAINQRTGDGVSIVTHAVLQAATDLTCAIGQNRATILKVNGVRGGGRG